MNFAAIFSLVQTIIKIFPSIQTVIMELTSTLKSTAPATFPATPADTPTGEHPIETVRALQKVLNQYVKPVPALEEDGFYGPKTDEALKKALAMFGLKV